jgi:hypothetical protein
MRGINARGQESTKRMAGIICLQESNWSIYQGLCLVCRVVNMWIGVTWV